MMQTILGCYQRWENESVFVFLEICGACWSTKSTNSSFSQMLETKNSEYNKFWL